MKNYIKYLQGEHIAHMAMFNALEPLFAQISEVGIAMQKCIANGGKILIMGNGGSAADSQHIAAEIVGRFKKERKGMPAIALTTDTSILTSVGNDYGYDYIFARQIEALCRPEDLVIGITTSGQQRQRSARDGSRKSNRRDNGWLNWRHGRQINCTMRLQFSCAF
jgi:D-sedoheptulose 7-phosphate isomerase